MKKLDELQRMKVLEMITIIASLLGIVLTLVHGNLYDYFFNLFSIKDIMNFRMLYVSLFVYSTLALVVFVSLFFLDEKNPEIRFYSYVQGWLFLIMATFTYEWFSGMMNWGIQTILSNKFTEYPYNLHAKGASVIFFGALFVFWILEKKKKNQTTSKSFT
jgi:signal transduction histidine kinase